MKRIDVLKGIEQTLVDKAYEKGHISHRADGDWQKTDNGWVRVKGNSGGYTPSEDDEDAVEAVHDGLKDAVLDRWSSIYVQKSATRDMRSIPATKNMGF